MIDVISVYSDVRTGAPVAVIESGGSGYVYSLIGILAASGHSDAKEVAQFIADASGVVMNEDMYDINKQILDARAQAHMRDHQLTDLHEKIRRLYTYASKDGSLGYDMPRFELNEHLRILASTEGYTQPSGCDTIRNVHLVVPGKGGCECGQMLRRR